MKEFILSAVGRVIIFVVCYAVVFGLILGASALENPVIVMIVMIPLIIFGWRFINWITPSMFIWMSWTGWLIYFIIKLMVSVLLGAFIVPYHAAKYVLSIFDNA